MDNNPNFNPNADVPPQPPPSSIPDFNHQQFQQHQQPPPPPPPQWYPNQTHLQQPPHPPPPGMHNQYPNHPQHWSPHPSENHEPVGYPTAPYPPHQQFGQMNRPQMHLMPYHAPQVPTQSYSGGHQQWGNPNWTHQQGYEQPGQGNIDDWATRAKAWAAAKTAMDSQQQYSPFPHGLRSELQTQFHGQYANVTDPQHLETKPGLHPVPYPQNPYGVETYQQAPLTDGQLNNIPGPHQYGQVTPASFASGPDISLHQDGSLSAESTVHQKEVPSSYSSSAGREVGTSRSQMQFSSYPGHGNAFQGGHQLPSMPPSVDLPELQGGPYPFHNQHGELSDKPLDFVPRGNISSVYPYHGQAGNHMGVESSATMPINHSWASHLSPGSMYPSAANSGLQFDPSVSAQSPLPGQIAPVFADAYGASSSLPPKKAAVPNWLKEEIIKKKAVVATATHEYHKEEIQFEDEIGRQSFVKDDLGDKKSSGSWKSADEEEDDEDYVEAARTAAINKEIKRVLTEVLLKVTDDLFDEIASRVLNEEDLETEALDSIPLSTTIVPSETKGINDEDDTGKPSLELAGGLLGLVSYGTDSDDEPNETSTHVKLSYDKHEMISNGLSHDEKADDETKSMEKFEAASCMGAKNSEPSGRRVVDELVFGTNGNDRMQQNGISISDLNNNLREEEHSNQDYAEETSSPKLRIASVKRATEDKQSEERHEQKHLVKGKQADRNGSKDRKKEGSRIDEKHKDSASRKRPSHHDHKYNKETERCRRVGGQEITRRDQLEDEKLERSRHKHSSNSTRHKKGRSPSPSSRRKRNKADSSVSSGSSTDDESFDDSARKSRSKRGHRSPSPVRSRKRQVSRSPENSQRRQSSYSVEASRKKRSRSRSPRRHR